MLCTEIVTFAYIIGNIEQLFLACSIVINQFPVAVADRAIEVDSGTVISPVVRHIPEKAPAFGRIACLFQQRDKTDTVYRLNCFVFFDSCHFEDRGVEIFDQQILVTFAVRSHYARPTDNQRLADTSFVSRAFAAVQGIILCMQFAVTPSRFGCKSSVIAHKDDDGVIGFPSQSIKSPRLLSIPSMRVA